jgi:hypothetical protein
LWDLHIHISTQKWAVLRFQWFSLVSSSECVLSTSNYITTTSLYILSSSVFTDYCTAWCYVI